MGTASETLSFEGFLLRLEVGIDESVDCTKAFRHGINKELIFAAGEMWLDHDGRTKLIVESKDSGNILDILFMMRQKLGVLAQISGIEHHLARGGWNDWMDRYWQRVEEGCCIGGEEATCEALDAALVLDARGGCIAAYPYEGSAILEVCSRPQINTTVSVWAEINPSALRGSIEAVSQRLLDAIRTRL